MNIKGNAYVAWAASALAFGGVLYVTNSTMLATTASQAVKSALSFTSQPAVTKVEPLVTAPPVVDVDSRLVPNAKLTPGEIEPTATVERICVKGYSKTARNVPESRKKAVYDLYGVDKTSDRFEIDHLISIELGGSNSIQNLWPQSYTTLPYNAFKKDALENRLHALVCDKTITLDDAQTMIRTDWIGAYKKYVEVN